MVSTLSVKVLIGVTIVAVLSLAIIIVVAVFEDKPYYQHRRSSQLHDRLTRPLIEDPLEQVPRTRA